MRCVAAAFLACLAAAQMRAQETVPLRGVVTDAATRRPLVGVIVALGPTVQRVTRTDEAGGFVFTRVQPGRYTLDVRLLGFEKLTLRVDASSDAKPTLVAMNRIASLDTVRVRASRQGIFGVVAAAADLKPLPDATIQVVGVGPRQTKVDSNAQFFIPVKNPGVYVVRAKMKGFEPLALSVTLEKNDGAEIAMLLYPETGESRKLEMAVQDMADRMMQRGLASALVPRSELLNSYGRGGGLLEAIRFSPSFAKRTMRINSTVCVFQDGIARPGLPLANIDAEDVESVEIYGPNADRTKTLASKWPPLAPCSDTGQPRLYPGNDVVKYVVVWLKR